MSHLCHLAMANGHKKTARINRAVKTGFNKPIFLISQQERILCRT